jgi:hypothetical protein
MISALNGISILFSNASTVDLLQRRNARVVGRLARYEQQLATCGDRVRGLGAAPETLARARAELTKPRDE